MKEIIAHILGKSGLDIFYDGHVAEQTDILEGTGNSRRHKLIGLFPVQRLAVKDNGAFGGSVHTGEQVENRSLPCAVGANESHQLSGIYLYIEVVDSLQAAETDAQLSGLKHRSLFSHCSLPPSVPPWRRLCVPEQPSDPFSD